jgi:hypothetical protein
MQETALTTLKQRASSSSSSSLRMAYLHLPKLLSTKILGVTTIILSSGVQGNAQEQYSFNACYSAALPKLGHERTVFWCKCVIINEKLFRTLDDAGMYCTGELRSAIERSQPKPNPEIMRAIIEGVYGRRNLSPIVPPQTQTVCRKEYNYFGVYQGTRCTTE